MDYISIPILQAPKQTIRIILGHLLIFTGIFDVIVCISSEYPLREGSFRGLVAGVTVAGRNVISLSLPPSLAAGKMEARLLSQIL